MMTSWLLNVFSAVLIVSISSLLLPNGKISRFVKPFISIAVILIIVSPMTDISGFLNGAVYKNNSAIETDEEFLHSIALAKIDIYSHNCVLIAEKNGIKGCKVLIEYNIEKNGQPEIYGVQINLKNAVITADSEHIVILQRLKNDLCEYLRIKETGVKIDE